jgi:hypothetical protein
MNTAPSLWSRQVPRFASTVILALLVAGIAGLGLGSASASATTDDPPMPANTPMGPALSASIASIAPAYLTPSTSLAVRVAVTAGAEALTGVNTTVSLTTATLDDTEAIDAFLDDPFGAAVRDVANGQPAEFLQGVPRAPGTLDAGSAATTSILIGPGALSLPRGTSGVYGVRVASTADGVAPVTNAFVITWADSTVPRLDVAVLANVSGSPERVAALLEAAADPRVALAVDTTALPDIDPELAELANREVMFLPSGHVDISSITHAPAASVLDFAVERARLSAGPDASWLAVPGTLDQEIVDQASAARAGAVLAGTKLEFGRPEVSSSAALLRASSGATVPLALANSRLSELLASSPATDAGAAARLVAESALLAFANSTAAGSGPTLIAPGESWVVDGTRASDEVAALFSTPWVRPVTFASVLETANVEAAVPESAPRTRDVRSEKVIGAQQAIARLSDLAAATEQPATLLDGPARDILSSMALPLRADVDARSAAMEVALEGAQEALNSVRVTSSSELTLVSNSGNVPITVRNDLASGVTVVVAMTSRSPRLVIDEQPVTTVPAGTEQTVLVPVTAVSSGDVFVTVALRSEDGATLAVAQTLKVRVRAEWGNVATGVATAALVVLLIAGVYRTVRRGRRDTRTGPAVDEEQLASVSSPER